MFRIGFGYDVHRLTEDRPLILGGVEIPHHKGLEGHSDADVLTHSVIDALLGAAGKGDIGTHFPDNDPKYRGANSLQLLRKAFDLVGNDGYELNNLDATIVAQEPVLMKYIPHMCRKIAEIFNISESRINIKATTTESLGFCGRKEGIEAYAVLSLGMPAEESP
ncbi:2-C-methyl-D-erythritol 2,4-cyclodiphosphate synthase [Thermodesulfobacteriota bacterium]